LGFVVLKRDYVAQTNDWKGRMARKKAFYSRFCGVPSLPETARLAQIRPAF
jgi:hypothetical protein